MDAFGYRRKRPRSDFAGNGNGAAGGGGFGGAAYDRDLGGGNLGSTNKSKACTKFFSTSGCPYGEECHFMHFVPGGVSSLGLAPLSSFGKSGGSAKKSLSTAGIGGGVTPSDPGTGLGGFKTRLCNKYNTSEGCRFGEKCHFAHGEKELRKSNGGFLSSDQRPLGLDFPKDHFTRRGASAGFQEGSRFGGGRGSSYREPTPPGMAAAATFGASSTAKISIDASIAGAIIGKSGINAKQISRLSGAKLSIRDHETDSKLKNVEMEGSFEQIKLASEMVRELLVHKDVLLAKPSGFNSRNYKTKMCENFPQGTCTFGDRCHFAHSANELQEGAALS
ncbi:hypothetical protein O6H91_06G069900 [Diphasiastrum complanatum]|uniref:Uncharacterized protein n=1 Tax=Diphasiastrum complanatum TaxID=34168 RepID=A0ACC2DFM9_DIPCM|nr:hypothetical protein O6H91_06G069900 [Diphasiastrum complanatum]